MPVFDSQHELQIKDPETSPDRASLCIFYCSSRGFPKENVISFSDTPKNPIFSECGQTLTSILSRETQIFFCNALKNRDCHYVLLLTTKQKPLLVVTSLSSFGGLCLAIAIEADPSTVSAFLQTIPTITVLEDPSISGFSRAHFDPSGLEQIHSRFRNAFSFFESSFTEPSLYHDPLALFRLMKHKTERISASFGLNAHFLLPFKFDEPIRHDVTINTHLFSVLMLLLVSAIKQYGLDSNLRTVFLSADGFPVLCVHFRVPSEQYTSSLLCRAATQIAEQHGSFFQVLLGETARKEAQKIPGVGHMIQNDRYSAFGDHVLCFFSPVSRDWTTYLNRSPIFHLPSDFFDGVTF